GVCVVPEGQVELRPASPLVDEELAGIQGKPAGLRAEDFPDFGRQQVRRCFEVRPEDRPPLTVRWPIEKEFRIACWGRVCIPKQDFLEPTRRDGIWLELPALPALAVEEPEWPLPGDLICVNAGNVIRPQNRAHGVGYFARQMPQFDRQPAADL